MRATVSPRFFAGRAAPVAPVAPAAPRRRPATLPTAPGGRHRVSIDFGDGDDVEVLVKHQPDFAHMLHSVGAAGVRRKAANGFPTSTAPLIRDLEDIDADHSYMVWPRPVRRD